MLKNSIFATVLPQWSRELLPFWNRYLGNWDTIFAFGLCPGRGAGVRLHPGVAGMVPRAGSRVALRGEQFYLLQLSSLKPSPGFQISQPSPSVRRLVTDPPTPRAPR